MEKLKGNRHFMENEFHQLDQVEKQKQDWKAVVAYRSNETKHLKLQLKQIKIDRKKNVNLKQDVARIKDKRFLKLLE